MRCWSPRRCTRAADGQRSPGSPERRAVGGGLPEGLLDLYLDRAQPYGARGDELLPHAPRQVLRQHLDGRVGNGEQGAVDLREPVAWPALVTYRHGVVLLANLELRVLERQQDLVVDLIRQPLHQALELDEVEHVVGFGVEAALDDDPRAVVVPVQRLAAVTGEGNEMGR